MYDVIIVGAGPAGLTAAIYAARYRLGTLVISSDVGGTAIEAHKVENWPGIKAVSGAELMDSFRQHAESLGVKIVESEIVEASASRHFTLSDKQGKRYESGSVILAMGTKRRKLNVEGEDRFLGKGVSYCSTCDAPLFKGKIVAVVGGHNSAAMAALLLSEYAQKVYIVYRKESIRAEPILVEQVSANKKIEVISNANVLQVKGKGFVESAVLDGGRELKLQGLFIEIGAVPSSYITQKLGVKTDQSSYIIVDSEQRTSVPGVFAAGDITNNPLRQIVTAAAQGAVAAFSAYKYFKEVKK